MEHAFKRLVKSLNKNLAFIITIPIWGKYTKNKNISQILYNDNKNVDDSIFKDYYAYFILKPYIKYELAIPKK